LSKLGDGLSEAPIGDCRPHSSLNYFRNVHKLRRRLLNKRRDSEEKGRDWRGDFKGTCLSVP
jgi:hypothetical protein